MQTIATFKPVTADQIGALVRGAKDAGVRVTGTDAFFTLFGLGSANRDNFVKSIPSREVLDNAMRSASQFDTSKNMARLEVFFLMTNVRAGISSGQLGEVSHYNDARDRRSVDGAFLDREGNIAWREGTAPVAKEIFLTLPRYLRQPERGPPVG